MNEVYLVMAYDPGLDNGGDWPVSAHPTEAAAQAAVVGYEYVAGPVPLYGEPE